MRHSEKIDAILPILYELQPKFEVLKKTKANDYYKSSYADLTDVIEECKSKLNESGILVLQTTDFDCVNEVMYDYVTTRLIHVKSGQWIEARSRLVGVADMQKYGSAITYARRYTLKTILFLTDEDDDGNVAAGKKAEARPQTQANKSFGRKAPETKPVQPKVEAPKEDKPEAAAEPAPTPEAPTGLDKSKRSGGFRSRS